jgi:proline racemase
MKFSRIITTLDAHTEGTPERLVISGIPPIPGRTMLEKNKYVRENLDYLRGMVVNEPRGHRNMCSAFLLPPVTEGAHFGVLFLEPGGYPTMCGHGVIAICTILLETGMLEPEEPTTEIILDTPAGVIRAEGIMRDGVAESIKFQNVPSFLYKPDVTVNVHGLGEVKVDIAYGGNFYAILPAEAVGMEITPEHSEEIILIGTKVQEAINEQVEIRHPEQPKIDCVDFVEFSTQPTNPQATMKNAVVSPPGGLDRSPCGTGTSAKMATLYARGKLALHEPFVHESILGSLFYGELIKEVMVGKYQAVVSTIQGSAYITGMHQYVLDPRDPFPEGFFMGKRGELYGFEFGA